MHGRTITNGGFLKGNETLNNATFRTQITRNPLARVTQPPLAAYKKKKKSHGGVLVRQTNANSGPLIEGNSENSSSEWFADSGGLDYLYSPTA